jgi:uncharacterized protein (DUF1015 family)
MILLSPFNALLPAPTYAAAEVFTGNCKTVLKGDDGMAQLDAMLADGDYLKDEPASIYIYQVETDGQTQTGIWAQVAPAGIKVHEQVLPEKVLRISTFRSRTGLEAKPVLLIYRPEAEVKKLIAMIAAAPPDDIYHNEQKIHRVWRVHDEKFVSALITAFANIESVYMADGHHRLAANPFETLSALLMDTDDIRVKPYHRLIKTNKDLNDYFEVLKADGPVLPTRKGYFGLMKDERWYHLVARRSKDHDTETLAAIFDYIEYTHELKSEPGKLLFTLAPLNISEVLKAADAGVILPPKSTWIEPKIPYGLLMNRHNV